MKKMPLFLAAITVATPSPFIFVAPAQADSLNTGRYIPPFCQEIAADPSNPPGVTAGRCVSVEQTSWKYELHGTEGWAAQQCWLTETFDPDFFDAYFDSYSDCVRTDHDRLKELIGG